MHCGAYIPSNAQNHPRICFFTCSSYPNGESSSASPTKPRFNRILYGFSIDKNPRFGFPMYWRRAELAESKKRHAHHSWPSRSSTSSTERVEAGDFWVSEYGWRVRRLAQESSDEMRRVAFVQAEAFYVPMPLFSDLFFHFFQAEVLSGLLYKLRNSPPNRYACLVAVPSSSSSSSSGASDQLEQTLVGVVDVTILRDKFVLQHLQNAEEYLYVSGIAVSSDYRRQGVATVLLKACEMLCLQWGFEYLALRAYEDDLVARKLYSNAGYKVVSGDPLWMTTWVGRKRRVLMIKQPTLDI